jgi:hypothetical protein
VTQIFPNDRLHNERCTVTHDYATWSYGNDKRQVEFQTPLVEIDIQLSLSTPLGMLPLPLTLLSLLFPVTASVAVSGESTTDKLRGVLPARQSLYVPSGAGTWKCLSGDKEIPWSKVNDDFCDCPDGSDEPGIVDSFFGVLVNIV